MFLLSKRFVLPLAAMLVFMDVNIAKAKTLPITSKLICDNTSPGYPVIYEKKGSRLNSVLFKTALKNQDTAIKTAKDKLSKLKKQKASKSKITAATKARDAALKVKANISACQKETFIPRPIIPGPQCTNPVLTVTAAEACPESVVSEGLNVKLIPRIPTDADLATKAQREATGLYGFSCVYSLDGKTNPLLTYNMYYALNVKYESPNMGTSWSNGVCNPKAGGLSVGPLTGFGTTVLYPVTHQIYIYVHGKLSPEGRAVIVNGFAEHLKQFALPCSCKKKIYGYD